MTGRSSPITRANGCCRSSSTIRKRNSAAFLPSPISAIRSSRRRSRAMAGWCGRPSATAIAPSITTFRARPPPAACLQPTRAEACAKYPNGVSDPQLRPRQLNWLGTDDQGRDVIARLIYGFRISVLFGLTLTIASSIIGVIAGAVQGYFGGWIDLVFQRFIEIWTADPDPLSADHPRRPSSPRTSGFCSPSCCCSPGSRSSAWCGPSSCAAAISNMCGRHAPSACPTPRSCSSTSCPTPWWRP